ncbi:MAG: hypothetical protein WCC17_14365 [Candidatus Nitrosopolaris sp.]
MAVNINPTRIAVVAKLAIRDPFEDGIRNLFCSQSKLASKFNYPYTGQ